MQISLSFKHLYQAGITLLILTLIFIGCAKPQMVTSYYILEYNPQPLNPRLKLPQPLPYRIQVRNFKIPRAYDSVRIIARYSAHQINYYRYSLWAVRPQIAVSDLLVTHINAYRLFKDCQREFLGERPDYEITGEIQQIERFESELYIGAHLKMRFELYHYETLDLLVIHECDREVTVPPQMEIFVKAISDLVYEEAETFLEKVVNYFTVQQENPPSEDEKSIP
ncbi:MAG: ABC-type transport auxiliary lipoprotein family protein [bacterium]